MHPKEESNMSNNPIRLQKIDDTPRWILFLNKYSPYIMILLIIILMLLILLVIAALIHMGGGNITMMESGNYYYHLQDVI